MKKTKLACTLATVLLAAIGLGGCGGSGGSSEITATTTGTLEGSAIKGPVNGATVTAFAIQNGSMAEQLNSTSTDAEGHFVLNLGSYSGPVLLQMHGGSYTDEATELNMAMAEGDVMTAVCPAVSPDDTIDNIEITPLTSMAQTMAQNMAGGMTAANIAAANAAVSDAFMIDDILTTHPMNPLVSGAAAAASQDSRNYGMVLAAMSQYARDMELPASSSMVTALMNDAADGALNGRMGNSEIVMGGMMGGPGNRAMQIDAGTEGLADAMATFMTRTMNRSGLTIAEMQTLRDRLRLADGILSMDDPAEITGTISGTAFNGIVQNARVVAYGISDGLMNGQLASSVTDATGNFSLAIGAYQGPVMLRLSGGTFTDLATGTTMTMPAGPGLTALVPSFTDGSAITGVAITPLTSMAQVRARTMAGGMNEANSNAAAGAIGGYFLVDDILSTAPLDPALENSGAETLQNQWNYGMAIAAMSQYAQNIGMTNSSWMLTALSLDASDGVMDGMAGQTPINMGGMMIGGGVDMEATAGTSGLAEAMLDFMGAAPNRSGLTAADLQVLIDKLQASDGSME